MWKWLRTVIANVLETGPVDVGRRAAFRQAAGSVLGGAGVALGEAVAIVAAEAFAKAVSNYHKNQTSQSILLGRNRLDAGELYCTNGFPKPIPALTDNDRKTPEAYNKSLDDFLASLRKTKQDEVSEVRKLIEQLFSPESKINQQQIAEILAIRVPDGQALEQLLRTRATEYANTWNALIDEADTHYKAFYRECYKLIKKMEAILRGEGLHPESDAREYDKSVGQAISICRDVIGELPAMGDQPKKRYDAATLNEKFAEWKQKRLQKAEEVRIEKEREAERSRIATTAELQALRNIFGGLEFNQELVKLGMVAEGGEVYATLAPYTGPEVDILVGAQYGKQGEGMEVLTNAGGAGERSGVEKAIQRISRQGHLSDADYSWRLSADEGKFVLPLSIARRLIEERDNFVKHCPETANDGKPLPTAVNYVTSGIYNDFRTLHRWGQLQARLQGMEPVASPFSRAGETGLAQVFKHMTGMDQLPD